MRRIISVHLRFGCVEGGRAVTDVLRTLKHSECQTGEEIASCQQTGRRSQRESGLFFQEVAHFVQLRHLVRREDLFVLQHFENGPVLHAEMFGHQVQHVVENGRPRAQLFGGVIDVWYRVTAVSAHDDSCNIVEQLKFEKLKRR